MALNISPVHRNLHTRVTWFYLEFEDLFVVLGLAALMNIFGRWVDRYIFGIPMNVFLQYVVPIFSVPLLMLFKYGKPRGYLMDWVAWRTKPRVYCGLERDSQIQSPYLIESEEPANAAYYREA
jgi:hypothetical protein